jgi:hypothetical protein
MTRKTVKGNVFDELAESRPYTGEIAVVIKVFRIDVRHDGDIGRQLDEGTVALVRLDDHPVALAPCGHWCRRH